MSINKDEALRAKDLAENLMKKADFSGARRLVLRAQKLDSSLENISHMIMVCDVHCAAAEKLLGNEMDWYGILQVEPKADEVAIKKQYKKLALLLHPDKNKLPGAEAAFKLIGEAQGILLNKDKRSLHDMKRRTMNRPAPAPSYRPQQAPTYYTQPVARTNHNIRNNFTGLRPENQHRQQKAQVHPVACSGGTTFWTSCPFCHMRYEYARAHINKLVNCQSCSRQFTTFEVPCQGAPPAKSSGQTAFSSPQQENVQSQRACNAGQKHSESSATYFSRKESFPVSGCTAKSMGQATFGFPQQQNVPNQNPFNVEQKHPQSSTSHYSVKESIPVSGCTVKVGAENISRKRKRKKIVESSESSDSESSSESEEDIVIDKNGDVKTGQGLGSAGRQQPRRSVRSKREVSYKENLSDDDDNFVNLNQEGSLKNGDAERAEESVIREQSCEDDCSNGNLPNGINRNKKSKEKENGQAGSSAGKFGFSEVKKNSGSRGSKDSSSGGSEEPKILVYADPDFSNFDKLRERRNFKPGQTWAVYDIKEGMPRFYAYISKVLTPDFWLKITWLEADPDGENENSWLEADLPIAVGKFRFGITEDTRDDLMFSHVIRCEEGNAEAPRWVLPRKDETWALFKNWDINWSSDPKSHREYEYEFVEILSEYSEAAGVSVALLYKVKGFSSVFCRMAKGGSDTFQIPPHELYRFSHSVPSFRLTGMEGKGVPEGSYELDPASLPENMEEISVSVPPNAPAAPVVESKPTSTTQDNQSSASNSNSIVIPKPRFGKFDADKSKEKFEVNQIWALYSKEDGLPKYYAKIRKVEREAEFKLHISYMELKSFPENVIQWRDKEMPICCGIFRLKKGQWDMLTDVSAFSHQIQLGSSRKTNEFTILPMTGKVWAMYKNWSEHIKVSDLKSWEYEFVEVLDVNETHIEVLLLERVDGFDTLFTGSQVTMTVPRCELLRFSHQVPEITFTKDINGPMRRFVELDPKALSRNLFSSS